MFRNYSEENQIFFTIVGSGVSAAHSAVVAIARLADFNFTIKSELCFTGDYIDDFAACVMAVFADGASLGQSAKHDFVVFIKRS